MRVLLSIGLVLILCLTLLITSGQSQRNFKIAAEMQCIIFNFCKKIKQVLKNEEKHLTKRTVCLMNYQGMECLGKELDIREDKRRKNHMSVMFKRNGDKK